MTTTQQYEVHPAGNLWAVGNDDRRFVTEAEAAEYAAWLRKQARHDLAVSGRRGVFTNPYPARTRRGI